MVSPSHMAEIGATLVEYRQQNFLCDTELCAKDKKYAAHSILLSAVSPVFRSAFESSSNAGMYCIDLPGIDSDILEIALHYIYTGHLLLPLCYSLPGALPKLFGKLEQLGLHPERFHGCEMTFESDVDQSDADGIDKPDEELILNLESEHLGLISGAGDQIICESKESSDEKFLTQKAIAIDNGFGFRERNAMEPYVPDPESVKDGSDMDLHAHNKVHTLRESDCDLNGEVKPFFVAPILSDNVGSDTFVKFGENINQTTEHQQVLMVELPSVNDVDDSPPEIAETAKKAHECTTCGRQYISNAMLEQHRLVHTGVKPYVCLYCNKSFSMKSNLERHEKRHTGIRPHLCELCGKGFIQKTALQYHMRTHQEELGTEACKQEVFTCSTCGLVFNRSANLRKHVQALHAKQELEENSKFVEKRSLLCDLCGKGFASVNSLKLHKMQHTGEKPFVCTICDKAFVVKAQLQYHARLHTGEKPFVCQTCGKGFVGKLGLTQHVRTHTGERPYICTVCGKAFTQSTHLKGHMRCHTGEKPNICHLCGKAYKNRLDLRFHYSRIHEINITRPKQQILKIEHF